MKKLIIQFATLTLSALCTYAQVQPGDQRISSPPTAAPWSGTNSVGATGVIATNQPYSLNELATQLANLNTAVEQTMPVLSAVTSQAASAPASRGQELANAVSGVLSGALGRGTNAGSAGLGRYSSGVSNFLNGLSGSNTNATGMASLDAITLGQLRTLQSDLNPVLTILRNLRIGTNQVSYPQGTPSAPVAPTGR